MSLYQLYKLVATATSLAFIGLHATTAYGEYILNPQHRLQIGIGGYARVYSGKLESYQYNNVLKAQPELTAKYLVSDTLTLRAKYAYRIVRDELLGEGRRSTDDRKNVPYSVFMTPPLSRVGMTEEQARESGADIQVVTLPVAAIPRARVMNDTRGVLKAIVDNKTQRILGASLLCVDSHEMINIVKMVMDAGLPYSILRDQIFTHPSMSESLNDLFSLVK